MKFLCYVGARFGKSVRVSLEAGKVVVIEVDSNILPKFATKKEIEDHVSALYFWGQEQYAQAKDNYNKCEASLH